MSRRNYTPSQLLSLWATPCWSMKFKILPLACFRSPWLAIDAFLTAAPFRRKICITRNTTRLLPDSVIFCDTPYFRAFMLRMLHSPIGTVRTRSLYNKFLWKSTNRAYHCSSLSSFSLSWLSLVEPTKCQCVSQTYVTHASLPFPRRCLPCHYEWYDGTCFKINFSTRAAFLSLWALN